jgi:hypothetical protein
VVEAEKRLCAVTGNLEHQWTANYSVLPPAFKESPKPDNPGYLVDAQKCGN